MSADVMVDTPTVVATAALPAYTVTLQTVTVPQGPLVLDTGLGQVLTATANGALPAIDGVTLGTGGTLLLTAGASGVDNQLYGVISPGSASSPWVLRSAPWVFVVHTDVDAAGAVPIYGPMPDVPRGVLNVSLGALMPAYRTGRQVVVQQGTTYAGTTWELTTAGTIVLGTTALAWVQV